MSQKRAMFSLVTQKAEYHVQLTHICFYRTAVRGRRPLTGKSLFFSVSDQTTAVLICKAPAISRQWNINTSTT